MRDSNPQALAGASFQDWCNSRSANPPRPHVGAVLNALADAVGDRETAKMARGIRREEERMQRFLERLIPQLTKAVVRAEIPASERDGGRGRGGSR